MSTPDPAAPPPPNNSAKKWLLGCLGALLVLVLLGVAVLMLGVYAVKKQVDAMAPDARRVVEDVHKAATALESAPRIDPALVQTAEARMRLGRSALPVAVLDKVLPQPCPADAARVAPTVDAEWFRELANGGLPTQPLGTSWFRQPPFSAAADAALQPDASEDSNARALVALDRGLADAGALAVIHTTRLEAGEFDGYVQLIGYPDGETICIAPFSARGGEGDFQQQFRAAEEAALRQ
jgi:hypothetical protein